MLTYKNLLHINAFYFDLHQRPNKVCHITAIRESYKNETNYFMNILQPGECYTLSFNWFPRSVPLRYTDVPT